MTFARSIAALLIVALGLSLSSCVVYEDDHWGRGGWHHEHEHWR